MPGLDGPQLDGPRLDGPGLDGPRVSSLSLDVELSLERVGAILGDAVKITRVDESTHPEVVNSFGVRLLPSFVLIKQGTEIWRHAGAIESQELLRLLTEQLEKLQPKRDSVPAPGIGL
ncbi:hypothetical protein GCM10023187_26540 [Nibrella viscosa]|uniref:Thioredoxin domain-containing protein n=2 Tax=Nibrella viscosa TaxID=1084524 RepID=A0ABP8KHS8_9BACT